MFNLIVYCYIIKSFMIQIYVYTYTNTYIYGDSFFDRTLGTPCRAAFQVFYWSTCCTIWPSFGMMFGGPARALNQGQFQTFCSNTPTARGFGGSRIQFIIRISIVSCFGLCSATFSRASWHDLQSLYARSYKQ